MFKSKFLGIVTVSLLTTACTMEEISATNQKVSDGASSIMNTLRGGSSSADNGMPHLSRVQPSAKESASKSYEVPVDVDTAAARLKRYYKFVSDNELSAVRKNHADGDLVANAMVEEGQEWESMPGSYYKMGSGWGDQDDHLTIELEKNGVGSRLCITYKSASQKRLASDSLQQLMKNIRGVAEGTLR
ncbi:hypothetical protein HQN64_23995 [Enterobacteriaceae bacterium BIT-l23]|uniref:hypothetical protein n=1 Tax=Jejubacter sp. L23 TaxID=3092086 RepID=UPI0015857470|nr:hypothetical protein [Enterobacteriaceae bacterium BIT-l23]